MTVVEALSHDRVHGIRVGRFRSRLDTTCILYRLDDVLIDTGPPNQWSVVRRFARQGALRRVVLTHHHEDHAGNLARLGSTTDIEILAPEPSRARLSSGSSLRAYQRVVWGTPRRVEARPVPDRIELADGGCLLAVPAPGHSVDMTCYLEPERGWLFTGDLYVTARPRYLRADEDISQEMHSLRSVLELDFDTIFCAHRGILTAGKQALQRKLDHLSALCERVRELRDRGESERRITRKLLGREDFLSFVTGFHYSKRNLVRACLAQDDHSERQPG